MFRKLLSLRTPAMRMMETQSTAVKNLIVEPLSSRELICVRGEEVSPFLQGLITNDMTLFNEDSSNNMSIYTMFLNKMGRVICDSIIYKPNDRNTFLIECDQGISDDLRRHLRLHRVHRKIDVESLHKEYKPWVIFSNDGTPSAVDDINVPNDVFSTTDPRGKFLGLRIIMRPEKTWSDLGKVISKKKDFTVHTPSQNVNYRFFRYSNGVGEGILDIPPGKCFPLEANCDFLNGISFHKGCYIGQELTARTYHMGVIRKRLMPIRLTATPTSKVSTIQSLGGLKVGTLRGVCANHALGLLRVEKVLNTKDLLIDGDQCSVYKPSWWPQEIQTRTSFWKAN